jgi:hypothetical protein
MCHTYCDVEPPFLMSYPKDPWFSLLNAFLLSREQSLPILKVLSLTWPTERGSKLTTSRMLSKSTTTRLPQLVWKSLFWSVNWKYSPWPFFLKCPSEIIQRNFKIYEKFKKFTLVLMCCLFIIYLQYNFFSYIKFKRSLYVPSLQVLFVFMHMCICLNYVMHDFHCSWYIHTDRQM